MESLLGVLTNAAAAQSLLTLLGGSAQPPASLLASYQGQNLIGQDVQHIMRPDEAPETLPAMHLQHDG